MAVYPSSIATARPVVRVACATGQPFSMPTRRLFGSVRKLPSGRWQASYWHKGERHVARETFAVKTDAFAFLSTKETDILRGEWVDPSAGKIAFADFASQWLTNQSHLRPLTVELSTGFSHKRDVRTASAVSYHQQSGGRVVQGTGCEAPWNGAQGVPPNGWNHARSRSRWVHRSQPC